MEERFDDQGPDRAPPGREPRGVLDAAPGLTRVAAGAWLRTAGWWTGTAVRAGRRLTRATLSGESPVVLAQEAAEELLEGARRVLGVTEIETRVRRLGAGGASDSDPESLRTRGEELLLRSSNLEEYGEAHPAFDRMLTQLAPDEARILRLLATEGPQPAVDVKTWRPLGIGSSVVAPGISMIGRYAGCMQPDRVPAYLANLFRLGLIWFSRDPVRGAYQRYQVIEAQPEVIEARNKVGRAMITRRSVRLTPFGEQFCRHCLPLDTAELEAVTAPGRASGVP